MSVLLDTHVWVWWLTADPRLPAVERRALDAAQANAWPLATHDVAIRRSRVAKLWKPKVA